MSVSSNRKKIRIVVAKPGLDGHDRGAKIIARALRDAGMEVIYTGLHQTPEQIVETVIQEDADAVGLSILSGAHMTLVPRIVELLREQGAGEVVVTVGGTIPADDIPALKALGVAEVFTPGATTDAAVEFIRGAVAPGGALLTSIPVGGSAGTGAPCAPTERSPWRTATGHARCSASKLGRILETRALPCRRAPFRHAALGGVGLNGMGNPSRVGVVFPQTEIGADPGAVREYAVAVSELGYTHIAVYDHVLGADPTMHPGWSGPYDVDSPFYEPFVLFAYLAALTSLELVSSIIILPQRQTALVAKQAATVDLLCGGKLRLGVGLGWNSVEYEALGQDFSTRGARLEEQIELMRRLWTERSVTFKATHETITGAGIAPLPIQRPIPIWFGGTSKPALRRAGRLGDGWFPTIEPGRELSEAIATIHKAAAEAGRDPSTIGLEACVRVGGASEEEIAQRVSRWLEEGATHLSFNTMRAGLAGIDGHIAALVAAASVVFG